MKLLKYEPQIQPRIPREREFSIDNLLIRHHVIIVIIRWTGLAPWEFEFPFPSSLTSTFLEGSATYSQTSCGQGRRKGVQAVVAGSRALLTETKVESGDVSKQKWNLCQL